MSDPAHAVFLSYASQDAEAAKRIAEALRGFGVEVWFDQSELRGGDAWDQKIRKQIKECALFVPIISANTQSRPEGYFRREWRMAIDRSHDMDDDMPFLLPVVVDDTPDAGARVPEWFRERQWTRLSGGEMTATFRDRVIKLLADGTVAGGDDPGLPANPLAKGKPASARPATFEPTLALPWLVPAIAGVAVIVALVIWQPWHQSAKSAVTASNAPATPSALGQPAASVSNPSNGLSEARQHGADCT